MIIFVKIFFCDIKIIFILFKIDMKLKKYVALADKNVRN